MTLRRIKQRTYEILEGARPDDRWAGVVDIAIFALISLNVAALMLETVEDIHALSPQAFDWFEVFSVAIFSIEYLLRLWSCTSDEAYSHSVRGRLRFMATFTSVIDLLAILPFFVTPFVASFGLDLRALRAARFVARFLKLARKSSGMRALGRGLLNKRNELSTVVGALALLLVLTSVLMYYAETGAQPEKFASIPEAMWWSIITLTTVGYGDVFPITVWGRILTGAMAVIGIAFFALPAGILSSSFVQEAQSDARAAPRICPHCNKEIAE